MHRNAIHLTLTETEAVVLSQLLNYSSCNQSGLNNPEGYSLEDVLQDKVFSEDEIEVDKLLLNVYTQLSRYLRKE